MNQTVTELKGEIDSYAVLVGDLSTPVTAMGRTMGITIMGRTPKTEDR